MRILRVFPRRTKFTPIDDYAFVGRPPFEIIRPDVDEVHISVTFTWDKELAQELKMAWEQYYPIVRIGGPAFNYNPEKFEPGVYIKKGVTFTSIGCNHNCPWCLVEREGKLKEISDFYAGNIVQDNNLLQCSRGHLRRVIDMLKKQRGIELSGGLDPALITNEIADELRALSIHQIFLAADTQARLKSLEKAVKNLDGFGRNKLRCYVLLGFDQTISEATEQLETVWDIGCMPHAQLYQPPDKWIEYSQEWLDLNRNWSRPAIMKAMHPKEKS